MKERYIYLMEKALSAYPDAHIQRYFDDVKQGGLTEHGFPRLTADIGILIAHGRRLDLTPIFLEMMDFCCEQIPRVKAANDFSVREIVCCLEELEAARAVDAAHFARWRALLATIEPTTCYSRFARTPTDQVRNLALFTGVSEYFRQTADIGGTTAFIETQIASQLQFLDENGMYMDNSKFDVYQPITYDLVPRGLFTLLLHRGYRGQHYEAVDTCLQKAGLLTLRMQSPNGENAFGGRSNQFLMGEGWSMTIFEYEARRYARAGDLALAKRFKAAALRALDAVEEWLGKHPIRHIRNRFPTETKFGCEKYAYFDKYMITTASNLYAAYLVCDESIPAEATPDLAPAAFATSRFFHKLFLKAEGYGVEFDTNADPTYDATGLGRVHRAGAPAAIALSVPCPAQPNYTVDVEPTPLSLCSGVRRGEGWHFVSEGDVPYEIVSHTAGEDTATATLACRFAQGDVTEEHAVSENGVEILVTGKGDLAYQLPAFDFDGERHTEITVEKHALTVTYGGWCCRYQTDGEIVDLGRLAANRNGRYRAFAAVGGERLGVHIEILPVKGAEPL